jgi:CubicO group peptidase (beta-lactamase class C family)
MHDVMQRFVEQGTVPGIVTLVSRRGEVHADALGVQSLGRDEPMRRNTIFRIASLTKPITAAATMILVEECKLRLDESVDRLLPELANRRVLKRLDAALDETVPASRPITVRDLLTFRMGFGSVMAPPDTYPIQRAIREQRIGGDVPPRPAEMVPPDEWMRRLGALPLLSQPGEKWHYHTPADVLGVLIARASFESGGGLGSSGYSDPQEQLVGILLTTRMMDSPVPPAVFVDFWTSAYQAIDD